MAGAITATAGPAQVLSLYPTALTVLNRAAVQVGQESVNDPFAETNPDWVLLRDLLTSLSRDLFRAMPDGWTHLNQLGTFTTDANQEWTMPAGYLGMVDGTLWNRTSQLPGVGPLTPQQEHALKASSVNPILNVAYQLKGNVLYFPVLPSTGQSIAFEFRSAYWVVATGETAATKDRATASTDVLLFDEELLVSGLKLRFLEERAMDTTKAQERFNDLLDDARARNTSAPILSLGGARDVWSRAAYGNWRVPEGNWPA